MECPSCSYKSPDPLVRCPECGGMFRADQLEELEHLRFTIHQIESWGRRFLLDPGVIRTLIQEVRDRITGLERALGVDKAARAGPAVTPPPPPTPAPSMTEREVAPVASPPVTPPQWEYRPAPPREPLSWAKVGDALLSRRTLQTFLYIGATLLVLSAIILVVRLWEDLHWAPRQVILLAGMAGLLWSGYQVREKMGLRLSGGVLMDIGALWVPLNVGALLFEFVGWSGDTTIPGIEIPVGVPMAVWMAIAATSAPVYAFLAYRFRLVFMLYGAAVGFGAALLTGLAALGVSVEWQLTSVLALGPAYIWAAMELRRRDVTELDLHLFWFTQAALPALLVGVAALVIAEDGSQWALTVAVWSTVLFYGVSHVLYRHLAFEYLLAIALPLSIFVTLSLHVTYIHFAWYNTILVGVAATYVLAGKYARKSPLWSWSDDAALTPGGLRVEPLYVVAAAHAVAAAVWPATIPSATVSLYSLVVILWVSAQVFQQRALAYMAAALLFAPFALTIVWLDIAPHWRALLFAPLAVAYLAAAEIDAARKGERQLPIGDLLNQMMPLKSLYARPLFLAGYAAAFFALAFAASDLIGVSSSTGQLFFEGGGPAPWTFLLVMGIFAVSAFLRRTSIFVHLAAWIFLPFVLLLAERGFYAGWDFDGPRYGLLLGGLSLGYLGLGIGLDMVRGHYSKPLYLVGYALTVVGMLLTVEVKEFNLAMVSMSLVVYAASAYMVHKGGHPSFRWLVDRIWWEEYQRRIARGSFLYLVTGLFPATVLLAVSFWDPRLAWYGVALAAIGVAYRMIPELFRHGDQVYRYQWYFFAIVLTAVGPLISLTDPTMRIVATGITTAGYAASAVITRGPLWAYPVAALLPVLLFFSMDRAGGMDSYYGVALLSLAVAYGVAGLVWRPDALELISKPQTGRPGSFTLAFLVVAFLVSSAGLGLATLESRPIIVAALSIGAAYYLIATIALRQTLLLYPSVGLLAAAYGVGLSLMDLDEGYYGLAVLPGVVVALAAGLYINEYPQSLRSFSWFLKRATSQQGSSRRVLDPYAPALPFFVIAYAGSVVAPALSFGYGWQLFWGLVAVTAIYSYSAWRFYAPVWSYLALLAAHGAFLRLLFLLSPDSSMGEVGAYWIPAVFLVAGLGVWANRVKSESSPGFSLKQWPPSLAQVTGNWAMPFFIFAMLGLVTSTVLASFEGGTGLAAGLAYGITLAVGTSAMARQHLGWAALLFLTLALGQGMRLAEVPLLDSPMYVALAGIALVIGSYVIRRLESSEPGMEGNIPARWLVWEAPIKGMSLLVMGLAPILGLAFWLAEGSVTDDLQPLALTLAITGLALAGTGYMERKAWLTYLSVAVLLASYMTQLVVFGSGQPQFFVLPAALYLMTVAYLERNRRERMPVMWLETAGLALLLGVPLMQALGLFTNEINNQVYGLFLFFESMVVIFWGAMVRWKRPFFGGIAAFIANLAVLLFDPLGEGPVSATILWSVFGAVGSALVAGAVYLERNREKSSASFRRLVDRLEAWD